MGVGGQAPQAEGHESRAASGLLFLELQVGASMEEDEGLAQFCLEPLSHVSS